ncbi:thioredoxin family protein [Ideonella margarita]|uniref:Thioredoxin family protein n=1 Tax=Ideonella margarita TaxID=2984191 RepID=A0ABU9C4C8_9BURK
MSSSSAPVPSNALTVACLCAGWCNTCGSYRPLMAQLAMQYPDVRFFWVDIEDHADALEDDGGDAPDIDNFPTLLVMQGDKVGFFGTVLPHLGVLERMVTQGVQGRLPALNDPATTGLAQRVLRLAESGHVPV